MRIYLGTLLLLYITGCVSDNEISYDRRLEGTWRSNRKETMERFRRDFPEKVKRLGKTLVKFGKIFGSMKVSYSKNKISCYTSDGAIMVYKYEIVDKGKDFVKIRSKFVNVIYPEKGKFMGKKEFVKLIKSVEDSKTIICIKFTQNGYWIQPDEKSKFMEKFNYVD